MTPLSRGIISSGKLGAGGGPTEFAALSANFNAAESLTYPDGACAGAAIVSIEAFFNLDSISGVGAIYHESKTTNADTRITLFQSNGKITLAFRTSDGGAYMPTVTVGTPLSTGVDYHVLGVINSATNTISVRVNDVDFPMTGAPVSFGPIMTGAYFQDSTIGAQSAGSTNFINGRVSFIGLYDTDKTSVNSDLYNGGDATCYGSRTTAMKAGELFFVEAANWSGHTGAELVEHVGAVTITNNGPLIFGRAGLTVEC